MSWTDFQVLLRKSGVAEDDPAARRAFDDVPPHAPRAAYSEAVALVRAKRQRRAATDTTHPASTTTYQGRSGRDDQDDDRGRRESDPLLPRLG